MANIRDEFAVHLLNDHGIKQAETLAEIFSYALTRAEELMPFVNSEENETRRLRAMVVTHLQEALFFAKRAIAIDPKNQKR